MYFTPDFSSLIPSKGLFFVLFCANCRCTYCRSCAYVGMHICKHLSVFLPRQDVFFVHFEKKANLYNKQQNILVVVEYMSVVVQ